MQNDPENLFNIAFTIKINTKKMKKLEKEYADVRKKEQEEMGELRVSEIHLGLALMNLLNFPNAFDCSVCETRIDC